MRKGLLALTALTAGCWKDEFAVIPPDVLQFQPPIEARRDWLVAPIDVSLECPDGQNARFYLLYPKEAAVEGAAPIPTAVLYPSGSFDFVYAPEPSDPLTGTHYADPSRLSGEWAIRQVFATLGMYPEQDTLEVHDGLLPVALAEAGIATMVPTNCWGDLWANRRGGNDNDFAADFFFREGRSAAEWAWRFVVDPAFAAAFDVELPIVVDPSQLYAIGLGEGGRAVAEVLSVDNDADGTPDYTVTGAIVDSSPDDLRVYFADAGLYASTVEGLTRIYPGGPDDTATGSFWSAAVPDRFGYLYSTTDPVLPPAVHDAVLARIGSRGWVYASDEPVHVMLNGTDIELARAAVEYLTDGTVPSRR